jgi:cytochrome b561
MAVAPYTRTAMTLHWAIAVLIAINVFLALTWNLYPDAGVRPAIDMHKSIGITVLGLAIMRLLWRLTHRPPTLPVHHKRWEKLTAHGVHLLLYLTIFGMPLTGWIMDSAYKDASSHPMFWFGLFEWPRLPNVMAMDPVTKLTVHDNFANFHENLALALYILVFAHVVGALKHQWIDRDRELLRMLPGRK